ncbi:MAG TPA: hypothetical protein VKE88_00235 [Candidatus Nanoarchaeia archaeon]|nr:hypothetical protein [Candidatus Nanoarchaeia archaeon]
MAEKHEPGSSQIRFEGVFDWKEFYHTMVGWFKSRGYEFWEEKNVRKPGTFGYEIEYEAKAVREESHYVKYTIEIKMHGWHMEDVEVIENGEKKQKNKTGMLVIEVNPKVELDWKERFEESKFKKKLRTLFHKHIIRKTVEQWVDKLYYECYLFQTKLRESLNMENKYNAYTPWYKKKY